MKHTQILTRAWKILWSYRALWIFGIIIGLTSASSGGGGGNNSSSFNTGSNPRNFNFTPPAEIQQWFNQMGQGFTKEAIPGVVQTWMGVILGVICLLLLIGILLRAASYVSQVSLVRMVDIYENSGEKKTFKEGWQLGWSRAAWRLFLIELVLLIPVFLVVIILFGLAALPVLQAVIAGNTPSVLGIIASVGLAFLAIFVIIVVAFALALILEIIRRVCVLQNTGVMESIRQGWQIVRSNLKDVFLMWLILVGVRIAYFIVVIPVVLVLLALGLLAGGGIGAVIYLAMSAAGAGGWIAAAVVGGLVFLLILGLPMLFLHGLLETYLSTTWTLAYRQVKPAALLEGTPSTGNEAALPA